MRLWCTYSRCHYHLDDIDCCSRFDLNGAIDFWFEKIADAIETFCYHYIHMKDAMAGVTTESPLSWEEGRNVAKKKFNKWYLSDTY